MAKITHFTANTRPARCVMVLGTTSGAGKSWLTTALCRYYSNLGLKVAPFKAQNMSNNARVVAAPTLATACAALPPEGAHPALGRPGGGVAGIEGAWGEIGSAQYFQALAARAVPEVRMNPLLLKPEADTRSQVVLMGQVSAELTALPWRGRSQLVWPQIAAALDALRAENDVVVIEGAGSPAETNLHASDIVNMRVARHAGARCLLVTDIDRGGAFAHLYGTWALLPEDERALIHGFVLNKFRGDASLLAPAPQHLQERTGVPTVATIPMQWHHGLPEEDGVFDMTPTLGTGVSSLPPEGALAARGGPSPLKPGDPAPTPQKPPLDGQQTWSRTIVPDDVLLFRYSALTFNGHRIHYDRQYVTQVEGYPGLIVHGPLIATLLVDLLRRSLPGAQLASFAFKAVRPTFDLHAFSVHGKPSADGKTIELWAQDHEGWLTMQATATLA